LGKAATCVGFESFLFLFDSIGLAYLYTETLIRSSTIIQQAKLIFQIPNIHVSTFTTKSADPFSAFHQCAA